MGRSSPQPLGVRTKPRTSVVQTQTATETPGVTTGGGILVISNAYARSSEDVIVVANPIVVTGSIITPWP